MVAQSRYIYSLLQPRPVILGKASTVLLRTTQRPSYLVLSFPLTRSSVLFSRGWHRMTAQPEEEEKQDAPLPHKRNSSDKNLGLQGYSLQHTHYLHPMCLPGLWVIQAPPKVQLSMALNLTPSKTVGFLNSKELKRRNEGFFEGREARGLGRWVQRTECGNRMVHCDKGYHQGPSFG